jgi:hypothetical protein
MWSTRWLAKHASNGPCPCDIAFALKLFRSLLVFLILFLDMGGIEVLISCAVIVDNAAMQAFTAESWICYALRSLHVLYGNHTSAQSTQP